MFPWFILLKMSKICAKNTVANLFTIDDRDLNQLIIEIRLQPVLQVQPELQQQRLLSLSKHQRPELQPGRPSEGGAPS